MLLKDIHINKSNPRIIKDDKFYKLVNSIKDFPKMLELRPIIIDESKMILGGNMRYKALLHLKYKEIPDTWVKVASELTEEERKRFIVEDNVSFGDWDYDVLKLEWNMDNLIDWGIDIDISPMTEKKTIPIEPYKMSHILISYPPELHSEVNEAILNLLNNSRVQIERSSN
jgi:hypothetical protein